MAAQAHNHQHCIRNALASAERVCAERGARLTPLRKRVLELIWESHEAIKAYDLLDRLGDEGGSAKPPTVYRALEFLLAQGLIHRIESENAYVGCRHPERTHEFQLLICDDCRHVEEISVAGVTRALGEQALKQGFRVSSQTVEVHGQCPDCRSASGS
ncbi:transcriptional repressor [Natronospira bacteriovora]|uniref:Transcriptional repressor n=1 Tax=Natronospira bacteriovora TaxID=3069753 RepID=A0ABU0W8U5_9GAMM|nr:transcriptional repressor [Natronospira sp. AB-CW4]MDQ2070466.1 transcriptional repressor [Natronospira sp. AB-CW4]